MLNSINAHIESIWRLMIHFSKELLFMSLFRLFHHVKRERVYICVYACPGGSSPLAIWVPRDSFMRSTNTKFWWRINAKKRSTKMGAILSISKSLGPMTRILAPFRSPFTQFWLERFIWIYTNPSVPQSIPLQKWCTKKLIWVVKLLWRIYCNQWTNDGEVIGLTLEIVFKHLTS